MVRGHLGAIVSVAVVGMAVVRAHTALGSGSIVSTANVAMVRGHLDAHATDGVDGAARDARVRVSGVLGHLG